MKENNFNFKSFDKTIIQTLNKEFSLEVENSPQKTEELDPDDINWYQEFKDANHMDLQDIIMACKKMATEWYDYYKDQANTSDNRKAMKYYMHIIEECNNWNFCDSQIV